MEYRRMGRTGLRVSAFCLGTMTFGSQTGRDEAFAIMDTSADAGVNFFDTADAYPNFTEDYGTTEEIVGGWLRQRPRDSIVLATKCQQPVGTGPNDQGLSRGHVLDAVEKSLRRLQTDYIDLYQVHFPDPETPIEETMQALEDLVRSGKVRYVGASNYRAWEMARALNASDRLGIGRYECAQERYNLLYRDIEPDLLPLCRAEGLGVIAYNPLAGGLLTGKYQSPEDRRPGTRFTFDISGPIYLDRYWHDEHFREIERLAAYFNERGLDMKSAAIAWVLKQAGVTSAIVGASTRDQISETLRYAEAELTDDDLTFCDEAWFGLRRRRA